MRPHSKYNQELRTPQFSMRTGQQTRPVHYHGARAKTGERSVAQERCPPVRACVVRVQLGIAARIFSPAAEAWFQEGYYKQAMYEIKNTESSRCTHHFDQLTLASHLSETTLSQD